MLDVIEFSTYEEGVKAFKKLESEGELKIVVIDDNEKRGGAKEYHGKKLYYIAVELEFED